MGTPYVQARNLTAEELRDQQRTALELLTAAHHGDLIGMGAVIEQLDEAERGAVLGSVAELAARLVTGLLFGQGLCSHHAGTKLLTDLRTAVDDGALDRPADA